MMLRLGLTGSIATGKSTALAAFAELGVPVIAADDIVHALYRGAAVAEVGALFPAAIKDGVVDRAALSRELVRHPEKLVRLEAVVHPLVRARIARFFAEAEASGAPLAVADIPLLFESGHDYGLDRVVVTSVDAAIQRQRALARPGMDVEKLDTIVARQLPQAEKRQRADYVLDTSMSIAATRKDVAALVDSLSHNPKDRA